MKSSVQDIEERSPNKTPDLLSPFQAEVRWARPAPWELVPHHVHSWADIPAAPLGLLKLAQNDQPSSAPRTLSVQTLWGPVVWGQDHQAPMTHDLWHHADTSWETASMAPPLCMTCYPLCERSPRHPHFRAQPQPGGGAPRAQLQILWRKATVTNAASSSHLNILSNFSWLRAKGMSPASDNRKATFQKFTHSTDMSWHLTCQALCKGPWESCLRRACSQGLPVWRSCGDSCGTQRD